MSLLIKYAVNLRTPSEISDIDTCYESAIQQHNKVQLGRIVKFGEKLNTRSLHHNKKQILAVEFQSYQALVRPRIISLAGYNVCVTLRADRERMCFTTVLRLMEQSHFVLIRGRSLQLQVLALANKINSYLPTAEFSVQIRTGVLRLSRTRVLTKKGFMSVCQNGLQAYLKEEVPLLQAIFLTHLPRFQQALGIQALVEEDREADSDLAELSNSYPQFMPDKPKKYIEAMQCFSRSEFRADEKEPIEEDDIIKIQKAAQELSKHQSLNYLSNYSKVLPSRVLSNDVDQAQKSTQEYLGKQKVDQDKPKVVTAVEYADQPQWKNILVTTTTLIQHANVRVRESTRVREIPLARKALLELPKNHPQYTQYNRLVHERKILNYMKNRQCDNIVRQYDPEKESKDYLVMEYMHLRSLKQYLPRTQATTTFRSKLSFLRQTANALRFLRDMDIVHLGVQPSNILIDREYNVKLGDFSSSHRMNYTSITNMSAKLRTRIKRMSSMKEYLKFQPDLTELGSLLELMEDLSATESLFDNKVLKNEVLSSQYRLRRVRAGNRLKLLVQEAMARSHPNKRQISLDSTEVEAQLNRYLPHLPKNWERTASTFVKAKLTNQKIIESQMDRHGVNFDVKYSKLDRYFWNKYLMCSTFVGEELKEKEDRRRTLIAESLQLQHIKQLYDIAMVNVKPRPEKVLEEGVKLTNITKQMDKIVRRNLRLADRLLARAKRHQGNCQKEMIYSSDDSSSPDSSRSTATKIVEPAQKKPRVLTIQKQNEQECKQSHPKEKDIFRPKRKRLPYKKQSCSNILSQGVINFVPKQDTLRSNKVANEGIARGRMNRLESAQATASETLYNNFSDIERIIEGIVQGEIADNTRVKHSVRKILLSSIEMKIQKSYSMPAQLKPTVIAVHRLWQSISESAPQSPPNVIPKHQSDYHFRT